MQTQGAADKMYDAPVLATVFGSAAVADALRAGPLAVGDIVWAKTHGFPWWPARVRCAVRSGPADKEGGVPIEAYPVRFYGDKRSILLARTSLVPYGAKPEFEHAGKKNKSKALVKKFELALASAVNPAPGDDAPDPDDQVEKEPAMEPLDDDWKVAGHEFVGSRVARAFGKLTTVGRITRWLPPGETEDENCLFHVAHDDGDEEARAPQPDA